MMRRSSGSKKGATPSGTASYNGPKASIKEHEKADLVFSHYADSSEESVIGPEGVERLCEDLAVDPADIVVLLFAWKLQAARMGFFTLDEWRRGLRELRVDSMDKLKRVLPSLHREIASPSAFQDFYRFAFQYCLTEPRQKTLDLDTACTMLGLVMAGRPHQQQFLQFLQEQVEYKAVTLDQWMGFLRFSEEVQLDLNNYDENMAWPLLLDNYVEWARKRASPAR